MNHTNPIKSAIVYLTKDLMFQSRFVSIARERETIVICGSTIDACIPRLNENMVGLVIVDLTLLSIDLASLASQARLAWPSATLLAYAPHVQTNRLAEARESGFDQVLTRGQFDQRMSAILDTLI